MPTPPNTWSDDYKKFMDDVTKHGAAVQQWIDDQKQYRDVVLQKFYEICRSKTPEEALLYFLSVVVASVDPNNGATIIGTEEDHMGVYGKSFLVTADNTQLTNDLQNATTSSSPVDIKTFATQLDQLLKLFDPAHGAKGPSPDPDAIQVQACFDPSANAAIFQQLQNIRNTIYIAGDTSGYNPKADADTVFFDETGTGKRPDGKPHMKSFDEMQKNMGQKDDPGDAVEAAKTLTDANSILTSTTQSVNAALNESVSQLTGFEKNVQAFLTSFLKSWIDQLNAMVQNANKG